MTTTRTSALDRIAPPRLGRPFRWLLGSTWLTNLGDGLALAAGPLLVASRTDNPILVASAALLQQLPWVLFGLFAGVIADRHDRRVVMVVVNTARAAVLAVLAAAIALDVVGIGVVLVAMFVLGTTETFVDVTATSLLPSVVASEDLGLANARKHFGHVTLNRLAGPPIGAFLFAAGTAVPFAAQSVLVLAGVALLVRMARVTEPAAPPADAPAVATPPTEQSMRGEIVEGLRWLRRDPAVRTLTLIIVTFNVTYGATLAVFVLYAKERLGLGSVGFGVLEAVSAVGGIAGTIVYGRLDQRLGPARLMRIGLTFETLSHLVLAVTTVPLIAGITLLAFGMHEAVWGTTETTIRQRSVPLELQGRIASLYFIGVMGGLVVGAAIGGVIAHFGGITATYWYALGGDLVILVLIWRRIDAIATGRPAPTTTAA